ncbi:hypothetical protein Pcinc_028043, partial [Petrolisthes cinctipes]
QPHTSNPPLFIPYSTQFPLFSPILTNPQPINLTQAILPSSSPILPSPLPPKPSPHHKAIDSKEGIIITNHCRRVGE